MLTGLRRHVTGWVGWIAFAGLLLLVAGVLNVISGVAALVSDDVYVEGPRVTLVLDTTAWGWVHVLLGCALVVTALALLAGRTWARVVVSALVVLNVVSQTLLLPAYPVYSLLVIALDVVVLWAVVVHGDEVAAL